VVKGVEVRGQMPSPIQNIKQNGYGIGNKDWGESEDEVEAREDLETAENQLRDMRMKFPGADFGPIEAQINSMKEIQQRETPNSGRGGDSWGGNDALAADQGSWAEGPTPIRLFGIDIVPGITKGDKLKADIQKLAFKETLKKEVKAKHEEMKMKEMNAATDKKMSAAKNKFAARMEKREKEREAKKKKEKEDQANADQSAKGTDGEKKEEKKKRLDNEKNAKEAKERRAVLEKKRENVRKERERKAELKKKKTEKRNKRVAMT